MIEGERWRPPDRMPGSIDSVVGRVDSQSSTQQRTEDDADGVTPGIASWIAERADLFEPDSAQACFFTQLASRGDLQRFVLVDKTTGERPVVLERFAATLYQ